MAKYILFGRKTFRPFIIIMLGLLLIVSCRKQEEELYYFRYYWTEEDGVLHEKYQGTPKPSIHTWSKYVPYDNFGYVYFRPFEYGNGIRNENIIVFEFSYEFGGGIRWFIDAPYIVDGEKYHFDSNDSFLRPYQNYDNFEVWNTSRVVSGWMSFTREVEDPDIILSVNYEVDYKDSARNVKHASGGMDFSTKMAGKIRGGERLISNTTE